MIEYLDHEFSSALAHTPEGMRLTDAGFTIEVEAQSEDSARDEHGRMYNVRKRSGVVRGGERPFTFHYACDAWLFDPKVAEVEEYRQLLPSPADLSLA